MKTMALLVSLNGVSGTSSSSANHSRVETPKELARVVCLNSVERFSKGNTSGIILALTKRPRPSASRFSAVVIVAKFLDIFPVSVLRSSVNIVDGSVKTILLKKIVAYCDFASGASASSWPWNISMLKLIKKPR